MANDPTQNIETERRGHELIALAGERLSRGHLVAKLSEPDARVLIGLARDYERISSRANWGIANNSESSTSRFSSAVEGRYLSSQVATTFDSRSNLDRLESFVQECSTVLGYSNALYDEMDVLQLRSAAATIAEAMPELVSARPARTHRRKADYLSRHPISSSQISDRQVTRTRLSDSSVAKADENKISAMGSNFIGKGTADNPFLRLKEIASDLPDTTAAELTNALRPYLERYQQSGKGRAILLPYPASLGKAGRRFRNYSSEMATIHGVLAGLKFGSRQNVVNDDIVSESHAQNVGNLPNRQTKIGAARPNSIGKDATEKLTDIGGMRSGTTGDHSTNSNQSVIIDGFRVPSSMRMLRAALRVSDAAFGSGTAANGGWTGIESINPMLSIVRIGARRGAYAVSGFDAIAGEMVNVGQMSAAADRNQANTAELAAHANLNDLPARIANDGPTKLNNSRGATPTLEQYPNKSRSHTSIGAFREPYGAVRSTSTVNHRTKPTQPTIDTNGSVRLALETVTPLIHTARAMVRESRRHTFITENFGQTSAAEKFSDLHARSSSSLAVTSSAPMEVLGKGWISAPNWEEPASFQAVKSPRWNRFQKNIGMLGSTTFLQSGFNKDPNGGVGFGQSLGKRLRGLLNDRSQNVLLEQIATNIGVDNAVSFLAHQDTATETRGTTKTGLASIGPNNAGASLLASIRRVQGLVSNAVGHAAAIQAAEIVHLSKVRPELSDAETDGVRSLDGRTTPHFLSGTSRGATHDNVNRKGGNDNEQLLKVSVRLPDNSIIPLPVVGAAASHPTSNTSVPHPLTRTAIHLVLPAGGATPAAPVAALPALAYAVQARLMKAAVGLFGTDLGRSAALGVGEPIISAIRPFLNGTGNNTLLAEKWERDMRNKVPSHTSGNEQQSPHTWRSRQGSDGSFEFELIRTSTTTPTETGLETKSAANRITALHQKRLFAGMAASEPSRNSTIIAANSSSSAQQRALRQHLLTSATALTPSEPGQARLMPDQDLASPRGKREATSSVASGGDTSFRASVAATDKLIAIDSLSPLRAAALVGATWTQSSNSRGILLKSEMPDSARGARGALHFADNIFGGLGFIDTTTLHPSTAADAKLTGTERLDLQLLSNVGDHALGVEGKGLSGSINNRLDSVSDRTRSIKTQRPTDASDVNVHGSQVFPHETRGEMLSSDPRHIDHESTGRTLDKSIIAATKIGQRVTPGASVPRWVNANTLVNPAIPATRSSLLPNWVVGGAKSLMFGLRLAGLSPNAVKPGDMSQYPRPMTSPFDFVNLHDSSGQSQVFDTVGWKSDRRDGARHSSVATNLSAFDAIVSRQHQPSTTQAQEFFATRNRGAQLLQPIGAFSKHVAGQIAPPRQNGSFSGVPRRQFEVHDGFAWLRPDVPNLTAQENSVGIASRQFRQAVAPTPVWTQPNSSRSTKVPLDHGMTSGALDGAFRHLTSLQFVDSTAARHLGTSVASINDPQQNGSVPNFVNGTLSYLQNQPTANRGPGNRANDPSASSSGPGLRNSPEWEIALTGKVVPYGYSPGVNSQLAAEFVEHAGGIDHGVGSLNDGVIRNGFLGQRTQPRPTARAAATLFGLGRRLPSQQSIRSLGVAKNTKLSYDVLVRLEKALDTVSANTDSRGAEMASTSRRTSKVGLSESKDNALGSKMLADLALINTHENSRHAAPDDSHGRAPFRSRHNSLKATTTTPSTAQVTAATGRDAMALVAPRQTVGSVGLSGMDTGKIAKVAASSGRLAVSELPLIAPMAVAVTQHAHLSSEQDAKPTNPSSTINSNGNKAEQQPAEPKVNLEKLAIELANTFVSMSQRELERRGIWGSR